VRSTSWFEQHAREHKSPLKDRLRELAAERKSQEDNMGEDDNLPKALYVEAVPDWGSRSPAFDYEAKASLEELFEGDGANATKVIGEYLLVKVMKMKTQLVVEEAVPPEQ
jgi:hypothetical protein